MSARTIAAVALVAGVAMGCSSTDGTPALSPAEQLARWCAAVDVWDNSDRLDIADFDQVIDLAPDRELRADLVTIRPLMEAFLAYDEDDPSSEERIRAIVDEPGVEDAFERATDIKRARCDL